MESIPQETVQEVHEEFNGVQTEQLHERADELHDWQPELMAFVQASIKRLDQDPADLLVYLFFMTCQMYRSFYGDDIQQVKPADIMEHYTANEEVMDKKTQGGEDEYEEARFPPMDPEQPTVMDYLTEVLKNARGEEKENLTPGEQAYIFLVIRSVVAVLNEKIEQTPEPGENPTM
ncbi:MAG: hypothetical protein ACOCSQ_05420 [Planctomycetota bacterium]